MTTGLVIKAEANFYNVVADGQEYLCTMRANLKKAGQLIKVGDQVRLTELEQERPAIEDILPRRNALEKPAIANVDQVLLMMSCHQPEFNFILVDRLLLNILYEGLTPLICISKSDLLDPEVREILEDEYQGFSVFFLSTETSEGFSELTESLAGKVSVLAGASGVGKSTLVNHLNPDCDLHTGEVNQKLGTGKHTTRHVSLHRIPTSGEPGWIADSPGFSVVHIPPLDRPELAEFYPEFKPHIPNCGFKDCLHRDESNCALTPHISEESIRYENYLKLLEEVELAYRQRTYGESGKTETRTKKAVGKNQKQQMLKLGTAGRVRSRRTQNQSFEQVNQWTDLDLEALEELDMDEWRI